ncbi:amidohydrolase [Paenibacillus algorifonticola]|uniref:Amidohydrolase n=1 Tax=Paenibacillus algorifonticola TaxID=684063 RepID=A0A1I2GQA1_9BACL|nr:amidohydrolase [Paenibacillus algorifonticola]SFF18781.1 amidohydrolase [Paenibacillus algorifonticola]
MADENKGWGGQLPEWVHEQAVAWRKHLHQHPELSFEETETAQFVEDTLRSFGGLIISRPTKTSVLARLVGAYPGKTLALRADMDALPIAEENTFDYVSQNPGVMHACGHDGHTAVLLATARLLVEQKERLHGEIRFIFQHAEELPPGGARELVEAGVLDGVDWIVGEHLAAQLPVGQIGVVYGQMSASPDNFTITVNGVGGHAGFPHRSVDTIAIGAQIVTNIQHIVARYTDPLERLVVSVTQFTAGASHNVLPDKVTLKGTVRSFSEQVRKQAEEQLQRIVAGIVSAHNAQFEFQYVYGYDPVVNDEALTRIVEEAAIEVVGKERVVHNPPGMGGEDFSAYQRKVPGTFINIGAGNIEKGIVYPHHHPRFAIDEDALANGVALFIKAAEKLVDWQS